MEKEDSKNIQHISDTLDEIFAFLKKPRNIFIRVFEVGAMIMSVLAIIGIIDIILKWIRGG